jgi:sterol desaturase/sphingolipid hydroxylase (fatty acid hydroxylase superfamily)
MCFFHPNEILLLASVSTLLYGFVLGLTPEAASLGGVYFILTGLFEHSNLRTPKWVGYFVQRPEQHGIHHQRGLHATNYAELPLWDWVFGTFRNPARWHAEAGFYDGALSQWRGLLAGKDLVKASSSKPARRLGR